MNLCLFLAIGESWEDFEAKGQAALLLKNNLSFYSKHFTSVSVFSYGKKSLQLLPNVQIIGNRWGIHRYFYTFLLPLLHRRKIASSDIIRGYQVTSIIPGLIAKFLYSIPLIINYGYDYPYFARLENKEIRAAMLTFLERFTLSLCDGVIVTSEILYRHVAQYRHTGIYLIPNGINTQEFKKMKLKKVFDILFVGRLERQKNLEMLIEATSKLNIPNIKVVLIGAGSQREALRARAKLLHVDLDLLPPISHDKLPAYYNKARIFVLPSIAEGNPKVLLEAMSCECAVLVSNISSVRGIIDNKKNGYLSELTSKSFARSIRILLQSASLRNRLGKNARRCILKHFDSDKTFLLEVQMLKSYVN